MRQRWPRRGGLLAQFWLPLLLVAIALVYGTVGFLLIEAESLLDALYQTVLVLSTIGTATPEPRGDGAKIFTISLILVGVAAVFAGIGVGTETLVSGELTRWARRRRMTRRMGRISGHIVVCAYGRVGRAVVAELRAERNAVVVIEQKPELESLLAEQHLHHVMGDPRNERVLRAARIEQARGLVCAVDSDAANVYITLTARALNPALRIIARGSEPGSADALRRAGADEVISPYRLSGRRMALLVMRPALVEMFDLLGFGPEFRVEEVQVRAGSRLDGSTIAEALARHPGASILAVKQPGAEVTAVPDQALRLAPGDLIVSVGPNAVLDRISG